jgi:ABC-2 type transport system ATP-binding protein
MSVIQTSNLTKHFRRVRAVNRLDLQVNEGEAYALIGPNGSGKTTAIKLLMNIIRPTSGSAEVLGTSIFDLRGAKFAHIGYVSENQELPLWMTVNALLRYLQPFYPTWDLELEKEIVARLDLPLNRRLRGLSRGTRMKAVLASVLAYRPKLLVLDEPFGGLDPLVRDELIGSLKTWAKDSTIFVSSHDLEEVESFATTVGYLQAGELQFSEPIAALEERFRKLELTFDSEEWTSYPPLQQLQMADIQGSMRNGWIKAERSGKTLRLIASHFDEERTPAEIQRLYPSVPVRIERMSLREIFVAVARSRRDAGVRD